MHPFVSVIIPVYGEARLIKCTLTHLLRHNTRCLFEVIVVDGDPRGTTLEAISFPRVKKILSPPGRGIQMNAGAAAAKGSILLFLHADTLLETEALESIVRALSRKNTAAGAFQLAIRSNRKAFRIIEFGVRLRTRLTHIPYGDQAIFASKTAFEGIGGFPNLPLMEDVAFMRRIRKKGGGIVILDANAFTSPRRWEKEGILYCTLRNWLLRMLYTCGVPAAVLVRFYRPHSASAGMP